MKRLTVGTMMGEIAVKPGEMLRGDIQTRPKRRFQALFVEVGDIKYATKLMDDMGFWAVDSDGVVDKANPRWIQKAADDVLDGKVTPSDEDLKIIRRLLDGRTKGRLAMAVDSAIDMSLELDRRVVAKEQGAAALDAKYAGDKVGWLYRADPPVGKAAVMNVGKLTINAGKPPSGKKPIRLDKKSTKRLAAASQTIDATATVIG